MLDTTIFGASLPAGTYAVGDVVELKCIDGPANVRSGRGAAILKRISAFIMINASGSSTQWEVSVQNSDWVDPVINMTSYLSDATALDKQSGSVQDGQNCVLTPNSSWKVVATCITGATTTIGNSILCAVDVDYPSVASIVDPTSLVGIPATLRDTLSITLQAADIESAVWHGHSVDIFKAGYEYALVKAELKTGNNAATGLIKISDAAGMMGLSRAIPTAAAASAIRNFIEYSSKLVKGPMTISYMLFSPTGSAISNVNANLLLDFAKRKV